MKVRYWSCLLLLPLTVFLISCQRPTLPVNTAESGLTPPEPGPAELVEAAAAGDVQRLRELMDAGMDPSAEDENGNTAFQVAWSGGHMDVLALLLKRDVHPDIPVCGGLSALAHAVAGRDQVLAAMLLQSGADANRPLPSPAGEEFIGLIDDEKFAYYLRKETGVTPLMLAAATGQLEMSELLLRHGADRQRKTGRHKTSAIWLAAERRHSRIVQLLLGREYHTDKQIQRLEISLSRQRVTLYRSGEAVLDAPISSGRKGYSTPQGEFVVTNKHKDWVSNLYDAPMPYFLRLNCGPVGLHAGELPGYPASHGCIRLPYEKARAFFAAVEVGTLVNISE